MAEDIVSIGIALDTSKVLAGTKQVDTALKQVAAASTTTAQATQKMDAAAKTAGQALTAESQAAQSTAQALRQETQATQSASQATTGLAQAARQAAATLTQTGQAAQSAGSQIGGMGAAMRGFASQTGSFALAQAGVLGFQAALLTAKDAVVDLVKTGIQMQNLRTSFAAVSGGATAGAKEFQFVVKTATQLGLSLQTVAEQYRSLSAATKGTTLQGADTRELFTTLSKAAQAYGLSTEQLGRAMTAFQQIISKGKVSMEELRGQLGEAIPGAMQIAARAYGTNTQALEDMISKGVAAEGFTRRFVAQLASEVPQAAERAGKGITNFGTEITLLKEAIAKSSLISWIDTVIGKLAELLRLGREGQERIDAAAEGRAARSVGGAETMDALQAKDRKALKDETKELTAAEKELKSIQRQRAEAQTGTFPESPGLAISEREAQQEVDRLRKALAVTKATGVLAKQEREEQAGRGVLDPTRQRTRQYGFEGYVGKEKIAQAQQVADLDTFIKGAKTLEETWRKAEDAQKTALRVGAGRDPSAEEKAKLGEKFAKDALEYLETNKDIAASAKDDPVIKSLREKVKLGEAASKGLVDAKKATQDASEAETKRAQEKKEADAEAKRVKTETERLDKQQADEVGRVHAQSIESLRQLNAKYTEAKTETDADRASKLASSLAYSKHAEEANKLAEAVGKASKALEDSRKTEAKLPALREQAQASAGTVSDISRLRGQLEPRRRSLSRAEQHAEILADLDTAYGGDPRMMAAAREQSAATLAFEETATQLERLKDLGEQTFDTLGDALTEFVTKGKLDFKGMVDSIASDLFRFATSTLMNQATKKGGWLEGALNLGLKALGIAGGFGGMNAATTANVQAGLNTNLIGNPELFQHGGEAFAGRPYIVGEAGPELFVPRTSGTVLPHGQGMTQPTVVNVHVSGVQDAQSFVQSRGAVSRAMMGALTQARQQM